jgi:hypothetical protein
MADAIEATTRPPRARKYNDPSPEHPWTFAGEEWNPDAFYATEAEAERAAKKTIKEGNSSTLLVMKISRKIKKAKAQLKPI